MPDLFVHYENLSDDEFEALADLTISDMYDEDDDEENPENEFEDYEEEVLVKT